MTGDNEKKVEPLPMVKPLSIQSLFSFLEDGYEIPLYQRGYAWADDDGSGRNPIEELIADINGNDENKSYYLGSLVVSENRKEGDKVIYEVVDGQQRLTTLYLLLTYLSNQGDPEYPVAGSLRFESRPKAEEALKFIQNSKSNNSKQTKEEYDEIIEECDEGIINGWDTIEKVIEQSTDSLDKKKLENVKLFRVVLPPHTDVNRYFEIMNNRGEQLEQHEVLKAKLMSFIDNAEKRKRAAFARLWDACANMNGYALEHLSRVEDSKDNPSTKRNAINEEKPDENDSKPDKQGNSDNEDGNSDPLSEIYNKLGSYEKSDATPGNQYDNDSYQSIYVSFPHFLLHTLHVYNDSSERVELEKELDADRLLSKFKEFYQSKNKVEKNEFAKSFVVCLFKCRVLFDRYVIKRTASSEKDSSEWKIVPLRKLKEQQEWAKNHLRELLDLKDSEPEWLSSEGNQQSENDQNENNRIEMLQSCLAATYTSPNSAHWITEVLKYLCNSEDDKRSFEEKLEGLLQSGVKEWFKKKDGGKENPEEGTNTPHVVFNYLDYLIWKYSMNLPEKGFETFKEFRDEFRFRRDRNSVEHWYAQNYDQNKPELGGKPGTNNLDRFGNLALMTRSENSTLQHHDIKQKKDRLKKIGRYSLKLWLMAMSAEHNEDWMSNEEAYENSLADKHETYVIGLLKRATGQAKGDENTEAKALKEELNRIKDLNNPNNPADS